MRSCGLAESSARRYRSVYHRPSLEGSSHKTVMACLYTVDAEAVTSLRVECVVSARGFTGRRPTGVRSERADPVNERRSNASPLWKIECSTLETIRASAPHRDRFTPSPAASISIISAFRPSRSAPPLLSDMHYQLSSRQYPVGVTYF